MKTIRLKHSMLAACAALALAAPTSLFALTADLTIDTFDTGTGGAGINWGSSTLAWDSVNGNPAGSLLVTASFGTNGNDTPFMPYMCLNAGNPWYNAGSVDLSLYASLEFDIMYDPTSDIDIAHFNDLSTWDTSLQNLNTHALIMQNYAGSAYMAGSTPGFEIAVCGFGNQAGPYIWSTNIPVAANGHWVHMSVPINPALSGLANQSGFTFHKWINKQWGIANPPVCRIWLDNIILKGTAGPPPPPKVSAPTAKATPGLNVFFSTASSQYDRQSAVLRHTTGLSWVGHATPENPVSYSFTIAGYPNSVNCEAWMYLCPNPVAMDNAPDWNETNCAIMYIQGSATNATGFFRYKVGEVGGQDMYSGGGIYTADPGTGGGITPESGKLAQVTNTTTGAFGTWTLTFTSDTAGTLSSPDGHTNSFTFPSYNATKFAEGNPVAFYIYLGGQANNPDAYNQPVVYSNFAVSGPVGSAYSENFLTDTVLDTTNVWTTSAATGPKGVFIVPAAEAGALWMQWTLPATGYSLEASTTLTGGSLAWTSPSINPSLGMVNAVQQMVAPSEIPAGNTAFFRLIKRTFTKLQILLPGEVAAPNTTSGKTGTPVAQSAGTPFNVIINAVDANWNVVNVTDDCVLTDPADGGFVVDGTDNSQTGMNLIHGTGTLSVDFIASGSSQITASDADNNTITPDTSPTVTY
jgi:hypothetical protein